MAAATRSPATRLKHILFHIEGISASLYGVAFERFVDSYQLQRTVERGIEIISEAVKSLPHSMLSRHLEIEWQKIIGIGNILRHEYQHVDRQSCGTWRPGNSRSWSQQFGSCSKRLSSRRAVGGSAAERFLHAASRALARAAPISGTGILVRSLSTSARMAALSSSLIARRKVPSAIGAAARMSFENSCRRRSARRSPATSRMRLSSA